MIGSPSSNSTVQRLQLPTSTHRPEHRPQRGLDPSTLVELDRLLDHAEVGSNVNGQNGLVPRSKVSALQRLTPWALRFTSSSGVWRRLFRCLAWRSTIGSTDLQTPGRQPENPTRAHFKHHQNSTRRILQDKVHVKMEHWSHVRYRSSLRTSCKVGSFAEALGADRWPRSDGANAFAAAHARSAAHLLRHAASTLPFSNTGAPWASGCAREVKKLAVSADHRPPTSPARMTWPTLLLLPVQSTCVPSAFSQL